MLTFSIVCHIPSHMHHPQESLLPAGVMGGRVAVVVDDKVPARALQQIVRGVPVQQCRVAPVPGGCATIQKSCKVFGEKSWPPGGWRPLRMRMMTRSMLIRPIWYCICAKKVTPWPVSACEAFATLRTLCCILVELLPLILDTAHESPPEGIFS